MMSSPLSFYVLSDLIGSRHRQGEDFISLPRLHVMVNKRRENDEMGTCFAVVYIGKGLEELIGSISMRLLNTVFL